jgi:hypothetical protein
MDALEIIDPILFKEEQIWLCLFANPHFFVLLGSFEL